MKVLILGCGRVGARLARTLSPNNDVTVLDWQSGSFERLGLNFSGTTVLGNGIDVDVLRTAGVQDVDVFVAVTDGDNRNLVSAQIARLLGAKRVLARVYDAERSQIFSRAGLATISPTIHGAERLFRLVVADGEGA